MIWKTIQEMFHTIGEFATFCSNFFRITESQNDWDWKGPVGVIQQQSHLEQVAQDDVQVVLTIFKEGDWTILLGNLFCCSVTMNITRVSS